MNSIKTITILSLAIIALSLTTQAQTVSIDLETEHQEIKGYGGMNHPYWRNDLTPHLVDKMFGNQPGQLGLSILRTYLHEDSNQWDRVLPTAQRAKEQHGATLFASPWTAPPHMKTNNEIVGGELLPEYYGDYADHLLDFVDFMEENDVPLYAVSLINEPDIEVSYHSTHWSSQQFIDFLHGQGHKFDDINLIVAESFNFNHQITNPILEDPEAEQHVDIIGGHLYGHRWAPEGGLADYPLAREKGKEIWMTEHLTGSDAPEDNTWNLALDLAEEVSECMEANFNAYVWWYLQRFYSFIDEAANVTDKGYVISQFTKFIRPGYVRVETSKDSAPNVDITAYKSDTSFVVVAVNKNNNSMELSIDIPGIFVDSLTQFTTSANKKVVNDGTISVENGTFNATIDSRSITTFTSHPENGQRYGNILPAAIAGENKDLVDEDNTGFETILLDGTESYDPDGEIVNYSWSINGNHVALTPTYETNLSYGEHTIVLSVTDNDGARDLDTITVTVSSEGTAHIWLEAECGEVGSNWDIHTDDDVSNGEYVMMDPEIDQFFDSPSNDANDHITYTFEIDESGGYKVWGRVNSPSYDDDSFWVKMNDGEWARWNGIAAGGTDGWHWNDVHDDTDDEHDGIVYYLDEGTHTLTIAHRENGTGLDKIYITNTGEIPSGLGEPAINCPDETSVATISSANDNLMIYPNPAKTGIHVEWDESFNTLVLFDFNGRKIIHRKYGEPITDIYIPLDLEQGVYILMISNEKKTVARKISIE